MAARLMRRRRIVHRSVGAAIAGADRTAKNNPQCYPQRRFLQQR